MRGTTRTKSKASNNAWFQLLEGRRMLAADVTFANAQEVDVAYDSAGTLHMAYYDAGAKRLMYAAKPAGGEWSDAVPVDSASADTGHNPSLAIDPAGNVGIAYRDQALADLKYAQKAPGGAWVVKTVDSKKDVGALPDLAFIGAGVPVISYYRPSTASIVVATGVGPKWTLKNVEKVGGPVSADSSIVAGGGRWAVAYEKLNTQVKLVQAVGAKAAKPIVIATLPSGGGSPSVTFDAAGRAAVSYYDNADGAVKLARDTGTLGGKKKKDPIWATSTVAVAKGAEVASNLSINPATTQPEVVYVEPKTAGIVIASTDTDGAWVRTELPDSATGTTLAVARDPLKNEIVVGTVDASGNVNVQAPSDSDSGTDGGNGGGGAPDPTPPPAGAPKAIKNLAGKASSVSSITLTWTDVATNETGYAVERSTDAATYTVVATLPADTLKYVDEGLTEGKYTYRIRTLLDGTTGTPSTTKTVSTFPNAPADLTAVGTGPARVALAWTDASSVETSYKVERRAAGKAPQIVATLPAGTTSYIDKGLTKLTEYSYVVYAVNASGTAVSSVASAATTTMLPGAFKGTLVTPTQVQFTWDDDFDNELGYVIDMGVGGVWTKRFDLPANTDTVLDTNLSEKTTYSFRIHVVLPSGEVNYSTITVATSLPAPTDVTLNALPGENIISWTKQSKAATGYEIQRSTDGGKTYATLTTVTTSAGIYSDKAITERVTYEYRVRATAGTTYRSDYVTTAAAPSPLLPPKNFAATVAVGGAAVNLSWDDASAKETGYRIERSSDGVNFGLLTTTAANVKTYADTSVVEGVKYYYRLWAVDSGSASPVAEANATTRTRAAGGLTATPVAPNQVNLAWADNSVTENGYRVQVSADNGATWQTHSDLAANATSASITTVTAGGASLLEGRVYKFRVITLNTAAGNSDPTDVASATTLPNAPTSLAIARGVGVFNLTWVDTSARETGYIVERSTDGGATWATRTTLSSGATSFVDNGVPQTAEYYYRVRAAGAGGNSAATSEVLAMGKLAPPSLFAVKATAGDHVDFGWIDNASGESYFEIELSDDNGATWNFAGYVGSPAMAGTIYSVSGSKSYKARIRAIGDNAGHESDWSNVVSFTTPLSVPEPTFTPAVFTATGMKLSWYDSGAEQGYKVERSTDGTNFSQIAVVPAFTPPAFDPSDDTADPDAYAVVYTDTTALASEATTYYYRVRAYDASGNTAYSDVFVGRSRLKQATNFSATPVSGTSAQLTWTDNSTKEAGYRVYAETDLHVLTPLSDLPANATSYTWTGLDLGTTYTFYVVALGDGVPNPLDPNGPLLETDSLPSAADDVTTADGPHSLAVTPLSSTSLKISWVDFSTTNTGYVLERSTNGTSFSVIANLAGNVSEYTDTGRSPETAYYYRVRDAASSNYAAWNAAMTWLPTPTNVTATALSATSVKINWTDTSSKETGYAIEFSYDGITWLALDRVGANTSTYTTSYGAYGPLVGKTTYYFRVSAVSESDIWGATSSAPSAVVSVKTL